MWIYYCTIYINLKLCTCAQSHAVNTHTKFQLEILTINVIIGIVYIHAIILESSRNVSETTPNKASIELRATDSKCIKPTFCLESMFVF